MIGTAPCVDPQNNLLSLNLNETPNGFILAILPDTFVPGTTGLAVDITIIVTNSDGLSAEHGITFMVLKDGSTEPLHPWL
jgi:hypothetical protein